LIPSKVHDPDFKYHLSYEAEIKARLHVSLTIDELRSAYEVFKKDAPRDKYDINKWSDFEKFLESYISEIHSNHWDYDWDDLDNLDCTDNTIDPITWDILRGEDVIWVHKAQEEMDFSEVTALPHGKMYRSGDMTCEFCQKPYSKHPVEYHSWALAAEDKALFHRTCRGDLVKL
jgi:hypothetical protein